MEENIKIPSVPVERCNDDLPEDWLSTLILAYRVSTIEERHQIMEELQDNLCPLCMTKIMERFTVEGLAMRLATGFYVTLKPGAENPPEGVQWN